MIERRMFLAGSAAAAAGLGPGGALAQPAAATSTNAGVFRHGVASGDPLPDAVVLWTRVTPTAGSLPGSGAGPRVAVGWQVASDPGFRRVVAHGSTVTGPERDHTVKVDVTGLAPATAYYYRFTLDGTTSPVGRTRTAPAPDVLARPAALRRRLAAPTPGRLVQRLPPPRRPRRPRRGAAPRRLPLRVRPRRVRLRPGRRGHPPARARPRDARPGRLPAAARAVQDRPRPAAPAREVPVHHHLGRPRGRQRRRGRPAPRTTTPDEGD